VWKKYELQKTMKPVYIAKKLPFCNEKSILPKILPFSNFFCQKLAINEINSCHIFCQASGNLAPSRFRPHTRADEVTSALNSCHSTSCGNQFPKA